MTSKIKRIYVDTSVVGAIADDEMKRQQTQPFWDAVQNAEIVIIVSDVLDTELKRAPHIVREFYRQLPESQMERVTLTKESDTLASLYIAENVVGKSSLDDCKHIALATIAQADVLVSWNFKHIVNFDRIRGYNSVNIKQGYSPIEIRTPYEVIYAED